MQTITVRATSNASGRAQRIAKGEGRQRTVAVDFSASDDRNLGLAAGTLGAVLGWQADDNITRDGRVFTNHSR